MPAYNYNGRSAGMGPLTFLEGNNMKTILSLFVSHFIFSFSFYIYSMLYIHEKYYLYVYI